MRRVTSFCILVACILLLLHGARSEHAFCQNAREIPNLIEHDAYKTNKPDKPELNLENEKSEIENRKRKNDISTGQHGILDTHDQHILNRRTDTLRRIRRRKQRNIEMIYTRRSTSRVVTRDHREQARRKVNREKQRNGRKIYTRRSRGRIITRIYREQSRRIIYKERRKPISTEVRRQGRRIVNIADKRREIPRDSMRRTRNYIDHYISSTSRKIQGNMMTGLQTRRNRRARLQREEKSINRRLQDNRRASRRENTYHKIVNPRATVHRTDNSIHRRLRVSGGAFRRDNTNHQSNNRVSRRLPNERHVPARRLSNERHVPASRNYSRNSRMALSRITVRAVRRSTRISNNDKNIGMRNKRDNREIQRNRVRSTQISKQHRMNANNRVRAIRYSSENTRRLTDYVRHLRKSRAGNNISSNVDFRHNRRVRRITRGINSRVTENRNDNVNRESVVQLNSRSRKNEGRMRGAHINSRRDIRRTRSDNTGTARRYQIRENNARKYRNEDETSKTANRRRIHRRNSNSVQDEYTFLSNRKSRKNRKNLHLNDEIRVTVNSQRVSTRRKPNRDLRIFQRNDASVENDVVGEGTHSLKRKIRKRRSLQERSIRQTRRLYGNPKSNNGENVVTNGNHISISRHQRDNRHSREKRNRGLELRSRQRNNKQLIINQDEIEKDTRISERVFRNKSLRQAEQNVGRKMIARRNPRREFYRHEVYESTHHLDFAIIRSARRVRSKRSSRQSIRRSHADMILGIRSVEKKFREINSNVFSHAIAEDNCIQQVRSHRSNRREKRQRRREYLIDNKAIDQNIKLLKTGYGEIRSVKSHKRREIRNTQRRNRRENAISLPLLKRNISKPVNEIEKGNRKNSRHRRQSSDFRIRTPNRMSRHVTGSRKQYVEYINSEKDKVNTLDYQNGLFQNLDRKIGSGFGCEREEYFGSSVYERNFYNTEESVFDFGGISRGLVFGVLGLVGARMRHSGV